MIKNISRKFRHFILPHEKNNYKARSLHIQPIIYYIVFLFIFQTSVTYIRKINPNILGYATDINVDKVLFLVNEERLKYDLDPLTMSTKLSTAATQKAIDMFDKNYWAHVSPTGTTPWEFITSSGYNYIYAGENLAKNFNTSEEVVKAWMNSPTHRANILKPEYSEIGISVMNGLLLGEETTLVVQEFGAQSRAVVDDDSQKLAQSFTSQESQSQSVLTGNIDKETSKNVPFITRSVTRTISLAMAEFLLIVLLIDSIFIWKYKTIRLTGHSLAHIIFFGALIGAMGATGIGVIL